MMLIVVDNGLHWAAWSVLARRVSRRPMDGHFWGKYIQNSLNLSKNLHDKKHYKKKNIYSSKVLF